LSPATLPDPQKSNAQRLLRITHDLRNRSQAFGVNPSSTPRAYPLVSTETCPISTNLTPSVRRPPSWCCASSDAFAVSICLRLSMCGPQYVKYVSIMLGVDRILPAGFPLCQDQRGRRTLLAPQQSRTPGFSSPAPCGILTSTTY